jgi:HTH-type transcriptional regulator / antitoxin HigA
MNKTCFTLRRSTNAKRENMKLTAKTKTKPAFDTRKYGELLARLAPVIIQNEKEYDRAIEVIDALVDKGEQITAEEKRLLDLFSLVVEHYEEEHYDIEDAAPHEVLQYLMEARDLQQKDLVHLFGSSGRASEAINGVWPISKSQAKALAQFFKVSAELFI